MNKKLGPAVVLLLVLTSLSGTLNASPATAPTNVGVNVGDTADYACIKGDLTWHYMHTQVISISGDIVSLNVTRFLENGTVDTLHSFVRTGNISGDLLFWWLIAAGLSVGDRYAQLVFGPSTINKTFTATIAGRSRVINEAWVDETTLLWWDKATGLMVRDSYSFFGSSEDLILVSTTAFGLDYSLIFLVLGCSIAAIVASIAVVLVIVRRDQVSRRMALDNKHQHNRSS
ncbi:MAG: hypothetical protein WED05_05175 [Candidatus Atabeyarchaeum deiterrae]